MHAAKLEGQNALCLHGILEVYKSQMVFHTQCDLPDCGNRLIVVAVKHE